MRRAGHPARWGESAAEKSTWRRFTTSVVATTESPGAPEPIISTPISWAEPANTSTDMSPALATPRPAFTASTP